MAAEGCRAAALDCRHDLQLLKADMAGMGLTPCRAMAAEDIRNLQSRAQHGPWRQPGGRITLSLSATCSSGLMISRMVLVATRV